MIRLALALSVLAAPAAAQGLTLAEAEKMTTPQRAERMLGESGTTMRESALRTGTAPFGSPDLLYAIDFASQSRSAGFPGLCEADVYSADLRPDVARAGGVVASRFWQLRVDHVYSAVSDLEPLPDGWNDTYGRVHEARCANAGPVLGPGFFRGSVDGSNGLSGSQASFAVRAFSKARDFGGAISCIEDRPPSTAGLCADPRAILKGLRVTELGFFEIKPCKDQLQTWCIGVLISRNPPGARSNFISIIVATDVTQIRGTIAKFTVRGVTIEGVLVVN